MGFQKGFTNNEYLVGHGRLRFGLGDRLIPGGYLMFMKKVTKAKIWRVMFFFRGRLNLVGNIS